MRRSGDRAGTERRRRLAEALLQCGEGSLRGGDTSRLQRLRERAELLGQRVGRAVWRSNRKVVVENLGDALPDTLFNRAEILAWKTNCPIANAGQAAETRFGPASWSLDWPRCCCA